MSVLLESHMFASNKPDRPRGTKEKKVNLKVLFFSLEDMKTFVTGQCWLA